MIFLIYHNNCNVIWKYLWFLSVTKSQMLLWFAVSLSFFFYSFFFKFTDLLNSSPTLQVQTLSPARGHEQRLESKTYPSILHQLLLLCCKSTFFLSRWCSAGTLSTADLFKRNSFKVFLIWKSIECIWLKEPHIKQYALKNTSPLPEVDTAPRFFWTPHPRPTRGSWPPAAETDNREGADAEAQRSHWRLGSQAQSGAKGHAKWGTDTSGPNSSAWAAVSLATPWSNQQPRWRLSDAAVPWGPSFNAHTVTIGHA